MSNTKNILIAMCLMCLSAYSATVTNTYTVKESGGDYTSLASWESGRQAAHSSGNIVSDDVCEKASIQGTWSNPDTSSVTMDGWTTDATRFLIVEAVGDSRHPGKISTTCYRIAALGGSISPRENYTRITGVLIMATNSAGNGINLYNTINGCVIDSCVAISNATSLMISGTADAGSSVYVRNCIFSTRGNRSATINSANTTVYILNCTFSGSTSLGIELSSGAAYLTNVIVTASANNAYSGSPVGDYCVSDDSTVPSTGSNNKINTTPTFVDTSTFDFHLAAGDSGAKDSGTAAFSGLITVDIDGETRTGTWDIGADEYIAPASSAASPYYFLRLNRP